MSQIMKIDDNKYSENLNLHFKLKFRNIDWENFDQVFHLNYTPDSFYAREILYQQLNINNTGILGLQEINQNIDNLFKNQPVLQNFIKDNPQISKIAFQQTKKLEIGNFAKGSNDLYIERQEFRHFLIFFKKTVEFLALYQLIDYQGENRLTYTQFLKNKQIFQNLEIFNNKKINPDLISLLDGNQHYIQSELKKERIKSARQKRGNTVNSSEKQQFLTQSVSRDSSTSQFNVCSEKKENQINKYVGIINQNGIGNKQKQINYENSNKKLTQSNKSLIE
ncbi:hypothetical protein PPERSA_06548 [Pseudocohnilembus persalinus]|uniref:Flagellar calcium-binding protein EF-hand domain-containing protein n=1 Tax=Pseudocohnilembus persalinus TaxID=266149 RepID=A0A0V0QRH5_PSEPJ|nr:hypothetical protein PPERSA_06548 [Pseudocohnilembus persalinus]|eukprot:KRX04914.1 hypothetical protein PPERSA_06548 [Pseudocohnilembus persalinus]